MSQTKNDERSDKEGSSAKSWATFALIAAALAYWFLSQGSATCDQLQHEVIQVSKENSTALQPKIIDIVEVKTTSEANGELYCTGIAILSSALKQNITFKKVKEYEKWWVKYEGNGLPFE